MKEPLHYAWISWLPLKKGGTARVPTDLYWMDARFEDQVDWPAEGWTLAVKPARFLEGDRLQIARVDFLVDEAPRQWLAVGTRFELLDGRHVVAHGLIVDAANFEQASRQAVEEVLLV